MPVKHDEPKVVKKLDDSDVSYGPKIVDDRSAGVVEKSPGKGDAGELRDDSV